MNDFNDDTKYVFLKTEAIQNLSQRNPERDKTFRIPEQQHLHPNFGQTNFAQKFRFGANEEIALDVNTLQNCSSSSQLVFLISEDEVDEAENQPYRQRALVYGEITPNVNTLQNCPGNSQSVSQSSSASEDDADEAEYQYYRHRALARPHWPPLEQHITENRGSHLGLAPSSPPGIGGSAIAS